MKKQMSGTSRMRNIQLSLPIVPSLIIVLQLSACQTAAPAREQMSAAEIEDDQTKTSISVAASYLDGGRPDKALYELQPLMEKYPNNIEILNLMGLTQLSLDNSARAVQILEKSWRLKAQIPTGVNLVSAYMAGKRYQDAEKITKHLLNRKDRGAYRHKERIYHNYGLVMFNTGRMVQAEKMFKRAVEENPMFYLSRMQLAKMYEDKKKPALALREYQSAQFACPHCFDILEAVVKHHAASGNLVMARNTLNDYRLVEGVAVVDRKRAAALEKNIIDASRQASAETHSKRR